ncbi:MAG TPA: helix-turn-helix domain-containing protein [Candidatus Avidesulfovibrio excrementigallinarum]|nr:helix-turn-helix domain-containing protein [Candidatus Avidesulfovibrio excrementigallinarum]
MKTRKTASAILNDLLRLMGFSKDNQLAEWLGVSAQAVSQARKKDKVPDGWLIQAALRQGLSLDALLFDRAANGNPQPDTASGAAEQSKIDISLVPLVAARLSAGGGSLETDGEVLNHFAFRQDWLQRKGNPEDMVLMRVYGDSMEPVIHHNDLVLVDQGKRHIIPHAVFAVGIDDEIYVKQVETQPGHRLVLRSFNERYAPVEIDMRGDLADSIRILGRAIWWCHEA